MKLNRIVSDPEFFKHNKDYEKKIISGRWCSWNRICLLKEKNSTGYKIASLNLWDRFVRLLGLTSTKIVNVKIVKNFENLSGLKKIARISNETVSPKTTAPAKLNEEKEAKPVKPVKPAKPVKSAKPLKPAKPAKVNTHISPSSSYGSSSSTTHSQLVSGNAGNNKVVVNGVDVTHQMVNGVYDIDNLGNSTTTTTTNGTNSQNTNKNFIIPNFMMQKQQNKEV